MKIPLQISALTNANQYETGVDTVKLPLPPSSENYGSVPVSNLGQRNHAEILKQRKSKRASVSRTASGASQNLPILQMSWEQDVKLQDVKLQDVKLQRLRKKPNEYWASAYWASANCTSPKGDFIVKVQQEYFLLKVYFKATSAMSSINVNFKVL